MRAPGQGAADIVRLRQQIAQLRGKVDVAERALRSELEDGQTSLAAAVENKVDGYFAESARLRRALHEQQQPHAANAPAAELRKLREQERQLRADVAQARAEHEFVHRALVQETATAPRSPPSCGVPTPRYRRRTQNTVTNEHLRHTSIWPKDAVRRPPPAAARVQRLRREGRRRLPRGRGRRRLRRGEGVGEGGRDGVGQLLHGRRGGAGGGGEGGARSPASRRRSCRRAAGRRA